MLRRVWAASVWHPDAITPEEWKYRNLKRVWLPLFDVIIITLGYVAALQGTPIMNRLFDHTVVDGIGIGLLVTGLVCLVGVAFPRLVGLEVAAKSLFAGAQVIYAGTILVFSRLPEPNVYIIVALLLPLPLIGFRLQLIGEEWKEARAGGSSEKGGPE